MRLFLLVFTCLLAIEGYGQTADIPLPSAAQLRWHGYERIMFIHISANTWQTHRGLDNEWDDHSVPLGRINPTELSTDQWCEVAQSWGAKMIIFVAKHVGGFCFWQTETTEYGIRNTPWKGGRGDVLEDLSHSCRKYGLDLGIYLYPGDPAWGAGPGSGGITSDPARQDGYTRVFRQQMTEVLSQYGEIREVWFDGSCRIDVADILARHAPDAVVFQGPQASLRWVGNEDGYAPFSNWYTLSSKDLKTGVATAIQSDPFGDAYAPVEIDVPLLKNKGHKWFWAPHADHLLLTTEQLMDIYYGSVGRGSVLLLNATPDTTGRIPDTHAATYRAFGDEIRRRFDRPLATTGGEGRSLELVFAEVTEINHVILQEDLTGGQRVLAFTLEVLTGDGVWEEVYAGTSIGSKRICWFPAVQARKVRASFTNVKAVPRIPVFSVFHVPGVVRDPELRHDRGRFYDGVHSQQGSVIAEAPAVKIGTWEGGDTWREHTFDLSGAVGRIGQYEITFTPPNGMADTPVEFRDWHVEMYGGRPEGVLEYLGSRSVFRLTRSQQLTDGSPTIFRVKARGGSAALVGDVTIRFITW